MLDTREYKFKIVTPLYLGGVDPRAREDQAKHDTEIRIRPILAMWRYWLRALRGAEHGTTTDGLARIASEEQRLFGGVRGEHPTAAGIRARLSEVGNINHGNFTEQEPAKSRYARYLGYGLQQSRQGGVVTEECRWAIQPCGKFTVAITAKESDFKTLEEIIDTWVHCGGLGARNRRGWGCIEWTNRPAARGDYFRSLAERMERYKGTMPAEPDFDVLHPDWCRIQICDEASGHSFANFADAMAAIRNQLRIDTGGAERRQLERSGGVAVPLTAPLTPASPVLNVATHGWRQRWPEAKPYWLAGRWNERKNRWDAFYRARDHDAADGARFPGGPDVDLQNIHFGLPVAYPTWRMTVEGILGKETLRRPSPISFRVFRADTKYKVAILLFKARFLPDVDDARICAKVRGHETAGIRMPQAAVIWPDLDAFFDACRGKVVFGK